MVNVTTKAAGGRGRTRRNSTKKEVEVVDAIVPVDGFDLFPVVS
ncbi:MAG: hypothetical protein ACLT8V_00040 [Streptococcus salivarius]